MNLEEDYCKKIMIIRIFTFFKKETVLCAAFVLAALSMFAVPPDGSYLQYIDYRTLAILFCLMSVMAGLQKIGVFQWTAKRLLLRVKNGRGLFLTLVLLCFFSSMFITNDVALITFVPFTFTVFNLLGTKLRKRLLLPVVAMQTIAANLGSMLTPIGNPQNLYLYGKAGFSFTDFVWLMLPYTLLALLMLIACSLLLGKIGRLSLRFRHSSTVTSTLHKKETSHLLAIYLALFLLCLLTVGHILPWQLVLVFMLMVMFVTDRQVLRQVDYSLLLTFVGFFIFIGNVGRIPVFCDFLQNIIAGREVYTAVIASQVISNVPAALLLSGFTDNYAGLIIGTNLGGLGTLIASMASLISYKQVAKEAASYKGKYVILFTFSNICFLAALILLNIGGALW